MRFTHLATRTLDELKYQLQWLWYSSRTNSFITGDDASAFALPVPNASAPSPLPTEGLVAGDPCNLPIPSALYGEFCEQSWHGYRFLRRGACGGATSSGDLLRTLVFGPDYGHPVLHPASGLVVTLRGASIELYDQTGEPLDKTKTRGRAALAFAAHPTEPLLVYGDNYGAFHAHPFGPSGFGKPTKIADKLRKASQLEFTSDGRMLVIGGMGYLATISCADGKFAPLHETAVPVREFRWFDQPSRVLVNQGLHGVGAYQYGANGFSKIGEIKPTGGAAVQQMAVSDCRRYVGFSCQSSPNVAVYEMSE